MPISSNNTLGSTLLFSTGIQEGKRSVDSQFAEDAVGMGVFKGEETGVKRKGVAGGVAVVLVCSSLVFGKARGGKLLVVAGFEEMRKVLLWWLWSSGNVEDGWCGG